MNNIRIETLSKLIYIFLYISLILGFYLNEDLAGGAIMDLNVHIPLLNSFKENFVFTFLNYQEGLPCMPNRTRYGYHILNQH